MSRCRFRVGDRVICVRPTTEDFRQPTVEKGKVYTIKKISIIGTVMLSEVKRRGWLNPERFEPYVEVHFEDDLFNI